MQTISIGVNEFLKGASTSNFIPDGGFSPDDKGHNLYISYAPGLLFPPPLLVSKGSTGTVIAYAEEEIVSSINVAGLAEDSKFYLYATDGTPTLKLTDGGARVYHRAISDFIFYKSNFYATSKTNIAKMDTALTTPTYDWWTVTMAKSAMNDQCSHQMEVMNDILYIANGSKIMSYNGSTANDSQFSIDANYYITSIKQHQNKLYIAAEPIYNFSTSSYHGRAKMFVWDGLKSTAEGYDAVYPLRDRIDSMTVYNGMLIVFTKRYVGYWNGINIVPLREISNPVYKHQITQFNRRLYFAHNNEIICYDGRIFSYLYYSGANRINSLICDNDSKFFANFNSNMYLGYLDSQFGDFDTGYWKSNKYFFAQNCNIRKVVVILGTPLVSGSELEFSFYDHTNTSKTIGSMTYAGGDLYYKEFKNINIPTHSFQLRLYWKTNPKPINQILVYYEPSETPAKR